MLKELSVTEQRYGAVLEVLREELPVVEVAARYGVTRQSVHNWLRRYLDGGLEALADRSHRPHGCPHQVNADVEARICELRRQHPAGTKAAGARAGPRTGGRPGSGASRAAIYRALVRNNLIQPRGRRRRHQDYQRWERSAPMQLWQLDISGQVMLADGRQVKLITGVDDHSRYCVLARVVEHATGRAVCAGFVQAMQRYGVPEEVLTDNGKQFTGRFGRPTPGEVLFERICRENGITQRLTKPRSPTTTGEGGAVPPDRAGRAAGRAGRGPGPFPSLEVAQELVDAWVADYNTRRPIRRWACAPRPSGSSPASATQPGQPDPAAGAEAAGDQPMLALHVPKAPDPDSATAGNGDGHPQRYATAPPATHAALDPDPDRRPDRSALDPPASPSAPAVLVPAPLEVQRYVHDTGAVRASRQTFSVGRHRADELVCVRLEGRVLHLLDAQGRLIKSVPRDPNKEGGQIPIAAKRMNQADEEGVKHQPTPNRQTSTET